jgi:hypothetical protein
VGRRFPSWGLVAAAFVALGLCSAVAVGGEQAAFGLRVTFFYLLVALTIWRCPLDARERDRLVTILMTTAVVVAVVGIAQQAIGHERLNELGYSYLESLRVDGGYLRSFSTFTTNFPFALYLMLVLLVGIPSALVDPTRRRNRLFLLATPVIVVGLASSITRAAWIGLAVGLVYLGITRFRSIMAVLVHGAAWAAIAALVLAGGVGSAFFSGDSLQERLDIWRDNVAEVPRHPLGIGIGATGSAADKLSELETEGETLESYEERAETVLEPDNYYFKTVLELGVIGLWILIMLLVTSFSCAHTISRRLHGPDGALASGVAASIVAAAAVSLVATYFEVFPIDVYFWMLLAVVTTSLDDSQPDSATQRGGVSTQRVDSRAGRGRMLDGL